MMYISSKSIERFESWFVIVSLFIFTGGPISLLSFSGEVSENFQAGSNPLEQIIFLLIHIISLFLIVIRRKKIYRELIKRDKFILLMLLLIMLVIIASTFWSKYPETTFRRSLALWGTTLFGVYFSTCHKFERQLAFLSQVYALVVVLSLIAGIVFPSYGIMTGTHAGAWSGIFLHKNGLGSTMVLSSLVFSVLIFSNNQRKSLKLTFLFFSFLLLILSTSKNALLLFAFLAGVLLLLSLAWLPYEFLVPLLLGAILVISMGALILFGNFGFFLGVLGKDLTFTGRTDIWPYVWEAIDKRFWIGYGYEGFWRGFDSDAASVWYAVSWQPSHPHNGLFELLLIFGFIWTSLFVIIFLRVYIKSIILARSSHSAEYFWPVLFLTFTFISNIGETKILSYNSLSWILFIMSVFAAVKSYQSYGTLSTSKNL